MTKFTKSEMMEELREIIFQYARGVSFALDGSIGYQVLFGGERRGYDNEVHQFMNPSADSKTYGEQFSIDDFYVTKSISEFYDYGLQGIRNISTSSATDATEWTFAYGLIRDTSRSVLISEACNGTPVDAGKCLYAAKAFFARLILDGFERTFVEGCEGPSDMLTIGEVAILADLDERTVRNATSKKAVNRLETAVVESNIYIPRESALAWLQNKRGFNPTRIGADLPAQTALSAQEFTSTDEAGDFARQNRERLGLDFGKLAEIAGMGWTSKMLKSLEKGDIPDDEEQLCALGSAIGLNGQLFALRMIEVMKKQEIQTLRRRMFETGSI